MINTVEALLFAAGRPLRISEIRSLLDLDGLQAELSEIKKCLNELEIRYHDSSLEITEVASGFRLQIKQDFSPALTHLWHERTPRVSKALMETISIITLAMYSMYNARFIIILSQAAILTCGATMGKIVPSEKEVRFENAAVMNVKIIMITLSNFHILLFNINILIKLVWFSFYRINIQE